MPLEYPIETKRLANGLQVVVSEDHTTPTVAVNLWVKVGSRHEPVGGTGFAHLFEHLMFQGSENVASGEHFSALMDAGARLNATTWFDRTNYFEVVPTGALELALWLEADRHGRLLPAVTQENLDNQRDVVKEEKRQRYDNQPYGQALPDMYAMAFPEGHPYHHPTIGSMEDLDAATLQDVHEFFTRYYGPNNTVLTLCGDIEPQHGFALAEKYFGELTASAAPARGPVDALEPLPEPVRLERHEDVPSDRLYLTFRLPVGGTAEFDAASLALDVLGGLASSRLYRRLVRRDQVATSIQAAAWGLVDGVSLGFVCVDVARGCDPVAVEQQVCEELDRLAEEGPTPEELEAVTAQAERSWLSALASIEERADLICGTVALHDDPQYINTLLDRLGAITAADVRAAAARWVVPSARATIAYLSNRREVLEARGAEASSATDTTDTTDTTDSPGAHDAEPAVTGAASEETNA